MMNKIESMDITISGDLLRKLGREAGKDITSVRQLIAEAIARKWIMSMGIPCWRSPHSPGTTGRYSLIFTDGRRALVTVWPELAAEFDVAAQARCEYQVCIRLSGNGKGRPEGFFLLRDLEIPGKKKVNNYILVDKMICPEKFPGLFETPRHFRWAYLSGSLRLLIRGEWKTPPPMDSSKQGLPGAAAGNI
jgi:hypothetical protein